MENFAKLFSALMLMIVSANHISAQLKDGEATVKQGSTTTVSIGTAYARTLAQATSVSATWTAGSSAISIQSRTNTSCTIKGNTVGTARLNYQCSYYIDGYRRTMNFYYDITIQPNTISVTRVEISPSSATMEIGETLQLKATTYPTNATNREVYWTTENYSIASVSNNGLVTARGEGKVWIWARAEDGSGAGDYCVVTVNEPAKVASIELSETEKTLTVGETFELTATVLPDKAYNKKLVWSSSNEKIASVDDGIITALSPGECDITCKSSDGSDVSAICHITVQEPEQYWLSVIVPNGSFAINVTDMDQINVKITPDNGYVINSVTLDGKAMAHNDGVIILPKFNQNSTLNIVFATETISGVEPLLRNSESLKVEVTNHTVAIKGLSTKQNIYVYNTNGSLIKSTTDTTFELPNAGIYILNIQDKIFKLAIHL